MLGGVSSVVGLIGLGTFVSLAAKTGRHTLWNLEMDYYIAWTASRVLGSRAKEFSWGTSSAESTRRPNGFTPVTDTFGTHKFIYFCAVYELEGVGRDGTVKHFEKPLAMTAGGSLGNGAMDRPATFRFLTRLPPTLLPMCIQ